MTDFDRTRDQQANATLDDKAPAASRNTAIAMIDEGNAREAKRSKSGLIGETLRIVYITVIYKYGRSLADHWLRMG
jgi:hypothetical protein